MVQKIRENVADTDPDYLLAEIPQALEQVFEGVDRVSTIVRSMKEFSHPGAKENSNNPSFFLRFHCLYETHFLIVLKISSLLIGLVR